MKPIFKDNYRKEDLKHILEELAKLFQSQSGFVIIGRNKEDSKGFKITDCYHRICENCVVESLMKTIDEAEERGLFAECVEDEQK